MLSKPCIRDVLFGVNNLSDFNACGHFESFLLFVCIAAAEVTSGKFACKRLDVKPSSCVLTVMTAVK